MVDRFENGFYLRNECLTGTSELTMRFEAYDANKQRLTQDSPPIPYPLTRFVSTVHVGSADLIYMLIFFETESYNPPPGIGIIQGRSWFTSWIKRPIVDFSEEVGVGLRCQTGGGGSVGITVLGTGRSLGASAVVTQGYSQPSACLLMNLHKYYYPTFIGLWASGIVTIKPGTANEFAFQDTHSLIEVQGDPQGN